MSSDSGLTVPISWLRPLRNAVASLACAVACVPSAAQGIDERDLRAAYLFNFIRFTEWPAAAFTAADAPINVCVLDSGATTGIALGALAGKLVGTHPIQVSTGTTLAAAQACHVVYVADAALVRLPALRDKLADAPTLLVGESDAALDRGAMIGFRALERRLGFIVNLGAARRAGLRLPPQLLKIAAEVRE